MNLHHHNQMEFEITATFNTKLLTLDFFTFTIRHRFEEVHPTLKIISRAPEWFWKKHVILDKIELYEKGRFTKGYSFLEFVSEVSDHNLGINFMKHVLSLMLNVRFAMHGLNEYNYDYMDEFEMIGCTCDSNPPHTHGRHFINQNNIHKYLEACGCANIN